MSQYQNVFQRYEEKYLMDEHQYQALIKFLQGRMTSNMYGRHTIS
ncbi:hypothetical protein JCM14036_11200 [Desulfotomaculum defluvii]